MITLSGQWGGAYWCTCQTTRGSKSFVLETPWCQLENDYSAGWRIDLAYYFIFPQPCYVNLGKYRSTAVFFFKYCGKVGLQGLSQRVRVSREFFARVKECVNGVGLATLPEVVAN